MLKPRTIDVLGADWKTVLPAKAKLGDIIRVSEGEPVYKVTHFLTDKANDEKIMCCVPLTFIATGVPLVEEKKLAPAKSGGVMFEKEGE